MRGNTRLFEKGIPRPLLVMTFRSAIVMSVIRPKVFWSWIEMSPNAYKRWPDGVLWLDSHAIRIPPDRPVNLSINLNAEIKGTADVVAFGPTYVFATPVFGGQFALTALGIAGRQQASIDATITGSLGPIGFATERSISDSLTAFGDVFLQPTLRWNNGVHNYMIYGMMNFPVGSYNPSRIVNLGLGHWSIDGGGGYTYFEPKSGWEFSAQISRIWCRATDWIHLSRL
jgi:hypothetical protein